MIDTGGLRMRLHQILRENAIHILKKELKKVQEAEHQSEEEIPKLEAALIQSEKDYEAVTKDIESNQQQIDLYKHESDLALEQIRLVFDDLTDQKFRQIASFINPPPVLAEVAYAFCLMIFQGVSIEWQQFQELAHTYLEIRDYMYNFQPELALTEKILTSMLPIWKDYKIKENQLKQFCPEALLLLDWVRWSVEYKLKKETLNLANNLIPELKEKQLSHYQDIEETTRLLEKEKTHRVTVSQDLTFYNSLSPEAKEQQKSMLAEKYQLHQKYELVTDRSAENKKITLRAINRNKRPRPSVTEQRTESELAKSRYQSWLTEKEREIRKSNQFLSSYGRLRGSQSSTITGCGTVADEAGSVADFETDTKSPLPSTYEDEGMVNYGAGSKNGRVGEFRFNLLKHPEEDKSLPKKNVSSSTLTPNFNHAVSQGSVMSQDRRRSSSFIESGDIRASIKKYQNPTSWQGRSTNSTARYSNSRRASMSSLPPQKPTPSKDQHPYRIALNSRYSGITNQDIPESYSQQHKRGYSVGTSYRRAQGLKFEEDNVENACCSGSNWRKFFCC